MRTNARANEVLRGQMIGDFLQERGVTDPIRDDHSCRETVEILSNDWWDIYDYDRMRRSGSESYYEVSPAERTQSSPFPIPEEFPRELYDDLSAWLPKREEQQRAAIMVDSSKLGREDKNRARGLGGVPPFSESNLKLPDVWIRIIVLTRDNHRITIIAHFAEDQVEGKIIDEDGMSRHRSLQEGCVHSFVVSLPFQQSSLRSFKHR
ncbi:unnamed protein product [Calypogeia fissa]